MKGEVEVANIKTKVHMRGTHIAVNVGNLMGQGQQEPTPLRLGRCTALIRRLIGRDSFKRMATYLGIQGLVLRPVRDR